MKRSGSRGGWAIVIPALVLGLWVLGSSLIARRAEFRISSLFGGRHGRQAAGGTDRSAAKDKAPAVVERMDDVRLSSLRNAIDSWRKTAAPRRVVVDQVCLVPDLPTFLEAIAAWDERHYFPILIDEPAWTLPFLRAFQPARVVRYTSRPHVAGSVSDAKRPAAPLRGEAAWLKAIDAVRRAGSTPPKGDGATDSTPSSANAAAQTPGLVIADPDSSTIGAAVALAAGHFQPLVRLGAFHLPPGVRGAAESTRRLDDVLTLVEAWGFARGIEARVSATVANYDKLGDDCDFLTIAGDWPYRYEVEAAERPVRGVYALDDLIGRNLVGGPSLGGLERSRKRWAYAGRIIGDPAASVARAMGALFLHPRSTLLWNTYNNAMPWSTYSMKSASAQLSRVVPGPVEHAEGTQADLEHWHSSLKPANRFGLFLINTSGGPDFFSIAGGPGRPGDLPRRIASAVGMIHSFSAADLTDPGTLAGRWLANGAYVYYGAVHEPFLLAFRPPGLVSELIAADVPLVAAMRQGELEPFGFPWRLIYLGDPLYRVGHSSRENSTPVNGQKKDGSKSSKQQPYEWNWWGNRTVAASAPENRPDARIDAIAWAKAAAPHELVGMAPIVAIDASSQSIVESRETGYDAEKLRLCLDAAIAEAASPQTSSKPTERGQGATTRIGQARSDWRTILRRVNRERLEERLRDIHDELLIDALEEVGALDELQSMLARIPADEAGPRVWQAHELCAFDRLSRLSEDRRSETFDAALLIWDEVMGLSWPKSSRFPGQFTERVAAMTGIDPARRLARWQEQLRTTALRLEKHPERFPHVAAILTEQTRVEAQRARR